MNSGTVHLIATDPPFNKNRDFHATPDSLSAGARFTDRWSWDRDVHEEWIDAIKDDWPNVWRVIEAARGSFGDDMGAFLCWLGVRLMEMHRVLRDDGSIYLHIDHTAHAYVKALMDGIFGSKNFRNEIVWKRATAKNWASRQFHTAHDSILFYVKDTKQARFNATYEPLSEDYIKTAYRYEDERGKFTVGDLTVLTDVEPTEWRGIKRKWAPRMTWPDDVAVPANWRDLTVQQRLDYMDANGLIYWPPRGKVPRFKRYLSTSKGVATTDVILDINPIPSGSKERTGYPTQKPLALYERIIRASSNEDDMVLDPFCGCATTPVAAERLGRQWVGMDIWDGAADIVKQRLESERRMFALEQVQVIKKAPKRTDDNDVAAPSFRLRIQRPTEPWQRLTHSQIVRVLVQAQGTSDGVICAGCGRILEKEFVELDHITPKSDRGENHILNRILLCRPCNGRKGNALTLAGLIRENKRRAVAWMRDEKWAGIARDRAAERAEWVRDNFGTLECQALIQGR